LVKGVNTLLKANIWIGGSYKKQVGRGGTTITVVIPPEVIGRKAVEAGLSTGEFIKFHKAIVYYDKFDGAFITF
jgi:hypothetical protein